VLQGGNDEIEVIDRHVSSLNHPLGRVRRALAFAPKWTVAARDSGLVVCDELAIHFAPRGDRESDRARGSRPHRAEELRSGSAAAG
jgi:hypothetical protein